MLSQKCQYAVRAIFELAKHVDGGPIRVALIAEDQAIPPRFLEVILHQLKQAGFVASRRGNEGGYLLRCRPEELTVGEIIRFVEGPTSPVACTDGPPKEGCRLHGLCVFLAMWQRADRAVSEIFDKTTFRDLLDEEERMSAAAGSSYSI